MLRSRFSWVYQIYSRVNIAWVVLVKNFSTVECRSFAFCWLTPTFHAARNSLLKACNKSTLWYDEMFVPC